MSSPDGELSSDHELLSILRQSKNLLFFGIGNLGRQDDGLGIRFVEELSRWFDHKLSEVHVNRSLWSVQFETNYQLNIEDALLVSEFDAVVFVDAEASSDSACFGANNSSRPLFSLKELKPALDIEFSTHSMAANSVLALSAQLYGKSPRAYMLAMTGESWEIEEGLSPTGVAALASAISAVRSAFSQAIPGMPHP